MRSIDIVNNPIDIVNNPPHYTKGGIECVDYIIAKKMGYLEGNIVKYITRYKYKGGVKDLLKAQFYLKRLISEEVGNVSTP